MIQITNINLLNVIKGCYTAQEIRSGNIEATEDIALLQKSRLLVCNECILNQEGNCYRDTDNIWQDENSFTQEELSKRKTILVDGKYKFGCGCVIVCKTALKKERCPCNKW